MDGIRWSDIEGLTFLKKLKKQDCVLWQKNMKMLNIVCIYLFSILTNMLVKLVITDLYVIYI